MPFPKIGQAIVAGAVILALLGSHSTAGGSSDPVPVQAQGASMLENSKWMAVGIDGDVLTAQRLPELAFETGGAFGGYGGCNRFKGQAEISGNALEFPDNIAATLMACPPEQQQIERQFFDALQGVVSYAVAGDNLVLLDSAGEPVLKFVRAE